MMVIGSIVGVGGAGPFGKTGSCGGKGRILVIVVGITGGVMMSLRMILNYRESGSAAQQSSRR